MEWTFSISHIFQSQILMPAEKIFSDVYFQIHPSEVRYHNVHGGAGATNYPSILISNIYNSSNWQGWSLEETPTSKKHQLQVWFFLFSLKQWRSSPEYSSFLNHCGHLRDKFFFQQLFWWKSIFKFVCSSSQSFWIFFFFLEQTKSV